MFMSSANLIFCQHLSTVFWFSCLHFMFIKSNSNMFIVHVVFGCVFRVHCVLVSRHAVLCVFPACVYSYIQIVSFAKSTEHC
jgi:hypothetical protein